MFNEYGMHQLMKLRQEETERNAREAWKQYVNTSQDTDIKEINILSKTSVNKCCQCACS